MSEASRQNITRWLNYPIDKNEYSHMLVICDKFDYEYYPVYIKKTDDIKQKTTYYNNSPMQEVIEIYNYSMDLEEQLNQNRVWNV
jgi:hypothetical protein